MNVTLERILHDLEQLPQQEQCELTAYLNQRLESQCEADDAEVAAAWESEINERVASIITGKAELIPGDEFEAQMATFMSDLKAGKTPAAL
jgi:primosomal protein N''